MSDEAVYRTALATPGLLNNSAIFLSFCSSLTLASLLAAGTEQGKNCLFKTSVVC